MWEALGHLLGLCGRSQAAFGAYVGGLGCFRTSVSGLEKGSGRKVVFSQAGAGPKKVGPPGPRGNANPSAGLESRNSVISLDILPIKALYEAI